MDEDEIKRLKNIEREVQDFLDSIFRKYPLTIAADVHINRLENLVKRKRKRFIGWNSGNTRYREEWFTEQMRYLFRSEQWVSLGSINNAKRAVKSGRIKQWLMRRLQCLRIGSTIKL